MSKPQDVLQVNAGSCHGKPDACALQLAGGAPVVERRGQLDGANLEPEHPLSTVCHEPHGQEASFMRTHGTLTQWNDDRGFGFIEPTVGTGEIFVHISAFPRDGIRPRIGELVSFEIELRSDGKKRALRIMRPGSSTATPRRARRTQPTATRQGPFAAIAGLLMLAAIGWYGYSRLATDRAQPPAPAAHAIQALPAAPAPTFTCDGRTRCSQMTSCAEATFFLKQCPGTQMDGDGDGEPCESQWCSGSWVD